MPPDTGDVTLSLISAIYESVADASRWPAFLEEFTLATKSSYCTLIIGDAQADEFAVACRYGLTDEDVKIYMEQYAANDPWANPAREGFLEEGGVIATHEFCPEAEQSEVYLDFYAPRGWHCGMGGLILKTATSLSWIAVAHDKALGRYGRRDLSLLKTLMPHLRRAALLHGELVRLRSERAALADYLDRFPHGFFLTDGEGSVLFANRAASGLAYRRDGIGIDANRLRILHPHQNRILRKFVDQCAADPNGPAARMAISRPSRQLSSWALVMPIPATAAVPLGVTKPTAAVLVMNPDTLPEPDPLMLQELFNLTPSESRIAALLVQGRSLDETAADLGIAQQTVRTHVKRILGKTATKRQGELIALILRSSPMIRGD